MMKQGLKQTIVGLLDGHRVLTLATVRADGYPHATMIGYVNDGLVIYSFVSRDGQKAKNLARDPRVSAALGSDTRKPLDIKGLSLAGRAVLVDDKAEVAHARALWLKRYPEHKVLPAPNPAEVALLRVTPEVVSVIDYSRGFGHSDLVRLSDSDHNEIVESRRHHWAGHP